MFSGKALTVNMREGQLFLDTHGNTTVCVSTQIHIKDLVYYLLIDVTQVYRLYLIWELALNAAMGRKHIEYFLLG